MASPYAKVDPAIVAWIERHGFTLCAWFGGEARFCYVTGGPQECFQIAVRQPVNGQVQVYAHSVETIDDAEMQSDWCVSESLVEDGLDQALACIREWIDRPKGPATWSAPWAVRQE
jgi:hypothetical protein